MESTITGKLATISSNTIETNQFLSLKYWFGTPNSLSFSQMAVIEIIVSLIFIASFLFLTAKLLRKNLTPPEQKFLNKAFWYSVWLGPFGWLLIFLRNQGVALLSARILWVIWFAISLTIGFILWKEFTKKLPESNKTYQTYKLKKKYFPKKKK